MASTAGKALQAVKQFTTTGNASRVSVTKEITIGLTLGIGAGLMWKSWHWNEKRKVSEYYDALQAINAQKASEEGE